jgi:uncharacterized integral membrane protein
MTGEPPSPRSTPAPKKRRRPREQARLVAGVVLGALAAAFAVLNLDKVQVNWILGTFQTPLIIVIAVSLLVGVLLDRFFEASRRRQRRKHG